MILLTGGSGTVGGAAARLLAAAGVPHRSMSRRPAAARPGTDTVHGDFRDRESLDAAMRGVRALLLVTTDPLTHADDENAIAAAAHAGVTHIVKLSALAVTESDADDLITRWQRGNEQRLRDSGLGWTLLRPRAFMSNTLSWAPGIRTHGVVRAPFRDAPVACVDPRDVAEVAVRALTSAGHAGQAYHLTGPAALTAGAQAAILADVLGRPLRFDELPMWRYREHLSRRYPQPVVDALVAGAERTAAGAKTGVDPTVEHITGRPAATFRQWAHDHGHAFAAPAAGSGSGDDPQLPTSGRPPVGGPYA